MAVITDSPAREPLSNQVVFDFGEIGSLRFSAPPTWIVRLQSQVQGLPPTIAFSEKDAPQLLVSVIPLPPATARPGPRDLWQMLLQSFSQLRPQVIEPQPRPRTIASSDGSGCFFTVTDRAPKAGEFLYQTSGYVPAGDLLLSFTVLTNLDDGIFFPNALATVRSAKHVRHSTDSDDANEAAANASQSDPMTAYLALDLNCDAAVFVQEHPELLEDTYLLVLQKLAAEAHSPRLRDTCQAAQCGLLLSRSMGVNAGVWAPGEILACPVEVLATLRCVLSADEPDRSEFVISTVRDALQKAGPAAQTRPWAILHLLIAQELVMSMSLCPELCTPAIQHFQIALNVCRDASDSFVRAAIALQLSSALLNQSEGDRASNIEAAIGYANTALEILKGSGFVIDWVTAKIRLGNAYVNRIRGYKTNNQEYAIECFESALPFCLDANSRNWAALRNNLGRLYPGRLLGNRQANINKAIDYLKDALSARGESSDAWAELHLNLGNAYLALSSFDVEATEEAIGYFEKAAKALANIPIEWARVQHNLGVAYRDSEIGDPRENAATAIEYFDKALTILTMSFPRDHRMTQVDLGEIYLAEGKWEEAVTHFHAAIEADERLVSSAITLAGSQNEFRSIGFAYSDACYCLLRLGRFEEAFVTLEKGKGRLIAQSIRRSRAPEQQENTGTATSAKPGDAVQQLELATTLLDILDTHATELDEQNRELARETREKLPELIALAQQARSLPQAGDSTLPLSYLLTGIPVDGALVAPVITKAGTAVFLIKGNSHEIGTNDIVWVDKFTDESLKQLLSGTPGAEPPDGWLNAYFQYRERQANWRRLIVNIGSTLWRDLWEPVYARLAAMGLQQDARIVLLPAPGLSLLPLHAAWRNIDGSRVYALEDYTITSSPSALLLANAQEELRRREAVPASCNKPILVVANPTGDLPFAAIEGRAVAAECDPDKTDLLLGAQALWSAVSNGFEKRVYIHFACHGVYDPAYPDRSFIALAPPPEVGNATGNLRLLELVSAWDTRAARLIVTSACETAITDVMDAPSEYMGLATGWLRAGVLGVIGSLWVVDDLCTMLLMQRFYQIYFSASKGPGGLAPYSALKAAQLWLKNLTNQQVVERLDALKQLPGLAPADVQWISARREKLLSDSSAAVQPFNEPYWWAGFIYAGV